MSLPGRHRPPTKFRLAREIAFAVVVGIWISLLLYALLRIDAILMGDFSTYWSGAKRVLMGLPLYPAWQVNAPYLLGDASFARGYVYPPTAAILSAPIAVIPLGLSWMVAATAMALATGGVTYRIARGQGVSQSGARWLTVLVVVSPPSVEALLTGNVNILIAAGLGLVWLAPSKTGSLAVLGALIKIYPITALAWAVRTSRPVLRPILVGVFIAAATLLVLGVRPWFDFVETVRHGQSSGDFPLRSPRAALEPLIGIGLAGLVAYGSTAGLLLAVVRTRDDHLAFLLLAIAMILPAPDWYLHYLIVPLIGALPMISRFASTLRLSAAFTLDEAGAGEVTNP